MSGSRASGEHVDGAWWPRSYRLADELPELLAAVQGRLGPVALVGYGRTRWTDAAAELTADGRTVHLLGLSGDDPENLIVIGEDGHHLTLRVIPPDTAQEAAFLALDAVPRRGASGADAAAARSVAEVARKLAEHEGRNEAEILGWCQEAAAQFDDARIQTFVPILVEHIVNDRIHRERHAGTAG
ncbi:hypothetical protein C1S82_08895 [Mycolicibacterium cosmeticum]|uniref:Uncharacterized protein n=1 Tax=Mycolicibacterium cosmeticum TaxID=258533 RepID=W9AVU4_MYCCO|nr:DUF5994 family protein [Mycolicibacterium cosmeticum]TLH74699.1 hypothetical protein C1S82_08895 [Mycolicibacterium cosmeticum]CDO09623.1 hypothetical protein BN977_04447 [Mycolicibacterium cosmeticum]